MNSLSIVGGTGTGTDLDIPFVATIEAMEALFQSVERSVLCAKRLQELQADRTEPFTLPCTTQSKICALYDRISKLSEAESLIATKLNDTKDAVARSTVQRLIQVDSIPRSPTVSKLLALFDNDIIRVTRMALESSDDEKYVLAKVAEDLYRAAQTNELPPPDAPEDLPGESTDNHEWIEFWLKVLNRCPHGPTIFQLEDGPDHPDSPRYLFRTFDQNSLGRTDQDAAASSRATFQNAPNSRDFCSLDKAVAAKMLSNHLNPPRPTSSLEYSSVGYSDNLTSWTSSLLYAIQYAIYRCRRFALTPSDVQICAVDVSKFPKGQFVRDSELIRLVESAATGERSRGFFNFRLKKHDYYNGEHLSQGLVYLRGRSFIFSLQCLEQSGLHELYPELADQGDKNEWTNRVLALRRSWANEAPQPISDSDVKKAYEIVRGCCVPNPTARAFALMLLCFKNREGFPTVKGMQQSLHL